MEKQEGEEEGKEGGERRNGRGDRREIGGKRGREK